MRALRSTCLGLALGALMSSFGESASDAADGAGKRNPIVPGFELTLEIAPARWQVKDTVRLTCTVKNVSDRAWQIADWGFMSLSPAIVIHSAEGTEVASKFNGNDITLRLKADAFPTLQPGESKKFALQGTITPQGLAVVDLTGGAWLWALPPGEYTATAVMHVAADKKPQITKTYPMVKPALLWTGYAASTSVKISVVAGN